MYNISFKYKTLYFYKLKIRLFPPLLLQQIHLSFGSNLYEYVVTWLTFNQTAGPATVWYGVDRLAQSVTGYSTSFKDLGPLKSVRYVHRVRLTGLKPDRKYCKYNIFAYS